MTSNAVFCKMVGEGKKRVGSLSELAKLLGAPRPALYVWRQIPIKYVHKFVEITGIPKERVRPDVYR